MKIKLTFLIILIFTLPINAQIYTPSGTIQGSSGNNNVGIGITTPTEKLVVQGNSAKIKIQTESNPINYNTYIESNYNASNTFNIVDQGIRKFGSKEIGIGTPDTYVSSYYGIAFATETTTTENSKVRMYLNQAGNVGIGTTKPDSKLTVNGNIHAKEVKIDLSIPVPDYVFANNYKLKTLQQVEDYINKNNHLPEIPSAQEIEKNGLMLAEMNMALLKKMEEMTLYMIEQNKRIEKLEMCNH